ncbi:MAG: VCBS repeat-containing protein [Flammeovirgaceae bacterium]|nr:MAG: VCBS repeat-containing protein [Flammeovirgaceae bacterium]
MLPADTGVDFENRLTFTEAFNCYTYRNFYNGAGVAIGDINNDGLADIYFSGNQVNNKLYLNKGNFQFEDITVKAGVACENVWSTGVSMADVNADGWLDIFVCKSGPPLGGVRHNELFINNGDLTFTERSAEWGVADEGLSIHAVFFDYDKDGDLDFYLLNNSNRAVGIFDLNIGQRSIRDPFGGNKLYRNEGSKFTDVSEQAGIYGSAIGFGLGVTVADVNRDDWQDIFVSNDFFERDYLYINNRDGTFSEMLEECINEISLGSMGADIADLNNDGYPEIYVTEMLPEKMERRKSTALFEDWNKYEANLNNGYYRQFSRNVLQLNNGPLPEQPNRVVFSEIGRFAGVAATDWSWGALIFDYNNDGLKDIFVANGIPRDLTDQDYIAFDAAAMLQQFHPDKDSLLLTKLINLIPSTPVSNYLFKNNGELRFVNTARASDVGKPGFSNGAAYGDLDNDGDLDLVVNNINEAAGVYRNMSRESDLKSSNFIILNFSGSAGNTKSFGARAAVYCADLTLHAEHSPVKGYMSSVDQRLHFGLGERTRVDSIVISWPNGGKSTLRNVPANQFLNLNEPGPSPTEFQRINENVKPIFREVIFSSINFKHVGNSFNDFNRHPMLFEMMSNEGQQLVVFDFNDDGLDDILIGGSAGFVTHLWLQQPNGNFKELRPFGKESLLECKDIVIDDFNSDGLPDVYLAAGGSQFSNQAPQYRDKLYINQGDVRFVEAPRILSSGDKPESTSFTFAIDYDRDGIADLVTGERLKPFQYGLPADARLLKGNGDGTFNDVTDRIAPDLKSCGLLRSGASFDFDKDGDEDIAITGEWMGLTVLRNDKDVFTDVSVQLGLKASTGLWNTLTVTDVNNDGFPDLIAGNQGLNSAFSASPEKPLTMYVHDFDGNGSLEQIICVHVNGKDYPLAMWSTLVKQIPSVKKIIQRHHEYKDKSIQEIFERNVLNAATKLEVTELSSMVYLNDNGKRFLPIPLPWQAQLTKVYAIHCMDVNADGFIDLLLAGNQYKAKPEVGISAAGYGTLLLGRGDGSFMYVNPARSGIYVNGEVRDIEQIKVNQDIFVIFLINNEPLKFFKLNIP